MPTPTASVAADAISAVQNVKLGGQTGTKARGKVEPVTPEVKTRGKQPTVLKNGKTLTEARKEAKETIANAKRVVKDAQRAINAANYDVTKANKALEYAKADKTTAEGNPHSHDEAYKKATLAWKDRKIKAAEANIKVVSKFVDTTKKSLEKANAELTKAENGERAIDAEVSKTKN